MYLQPIQITRRISAEVLFFAIKLFTTFKILISIKLLRSFEDEHQDYKLLNLNCDITISILLELRFKPEKVKFAPNYLSTWLKTQLV